MFRYTCTTYFVRSNFVVNFLNTNFPRTHITTVSSEVFHASQSELTKIAMFYAGTVTTIKQQSKVSIARIPANDYP